MESGSEAPSETGRGRGRGVPRPRRKAADATGDFMESGSEAPSETGRGRGKPRGRAANATGEATASSAAPGTPNPLRSEQQKKRWADDKVGAEKAGVTVTEYRKTQRETNAASRSRTPARRPQAAAGGGGSELSRASGPAAELGEDQASDVGKRKRSIPSDPALAEAQSAEVGQTEKAGRGTHQPTQPHATQNDMQPMRQKMLDDFNAFEKCLVTRAQALAAVFSKEMDIFQAEMREEVKKLQDQQLAALTAMAAMHPALPVERPVRHVVGLQEEAAFKSQELGASGKQGAETSESGTEAERPAQRPRASEIGTDAGSSANDFAASIDFDEAPQTEARAAAAVPPLASGPLNLAVPAAVEPSAVDSKIASQRKSAAVVNRRKSKLPNLLPSPQATFVVSGLAAAKSSATGVEPASEAESDSNWSADMGASLLADTASPRIGPSPLLTSIQPALAQKANQGGGKKADERGSTPAEHVEDDGGDDEDDNSSEDAEALLADTSTAQQAPQNVLYAARPRIESDDASSLAVDDVLADANRNEPTRAQARKEGQLASEDEGSADEASAAADELLAAANGQAGREGDVESGDDSSDAADELLADLSAAKRKSPIMRAALKSPLIRAVSKSPVLGPAASPNLRASSKSPVIAAASRPINLNNGSVAKRSLASSVGVPAMPAKPDASLSLPEPVEMQQAAKMQFEQFEENRWEYYRERGELGYDQALTSALSRSGFAVLEAKDPEKKSQGSNQKQRKMEWFNQMYGGSKNSSQGPDETKVQVHINGRQPPRPRNGTGTPAKRSSARQDVAADKAFAPLPGARLVDPTLSSSSVGGMCREPPAVDEVLPGLPRLPS